MLGVWITRDGSRVLLGNMSNDHIRNALWMIEDGRMNRSRICYSMTMAQWRLIFYAELRRRGL